MFKSNDNDKHLMVTYCIYVLIDQIWDQEQRDQEEGGHTDINLDGFRIIDTGE